MSRIGYFRKLITHSSDPSKNLGIDELLLLLAEYIDDDQITEVVGKYVDDFDETFEEIREELIRLRAELNSQDGLKKDKLPVVKMLTKEKQLERVTGLTSDELWDHGFDLDDWDICFISQHQLPNNWLLQRMDNYCCGYKVTEYNNLFYYIVYHA